MPPLTVLIPAHNEAETIAMAIDSVRRQTHPVDEIIVITDNCTDDTARIAASLGATVHATIGNRHKKAGALNQVLTDLIPRADDRDRVLVMDADSCLDPGFVAAALPWLPAGSSYGGIGGTFRGRRSDGTRRLLQSWVEEAQRSEYARYERDVRRKRGEVLVLTGTATIFNVAALREVVALRGQVYDTEVLTEDNELTFALRHLGWQVRSPAGCTLTTEVMPTWGELYRQRLRWKRGAMENLRQYGLTRFTLKHWGYQVVGFVGVAVTALYLASLAYGVGAGSLHLQALWIGVTAVFLAERVVTVRSRGRRPMLVAATLLPEMAFDLFLQATHLKALADAVFGRRREW
ncbi:cellulose synthase/poly-beta-1,6-N-acetylglucosamine synthase-like glycosyltransferase [Allocatelliglobosispora scoriae]|uniref:Cellulose synthase/poly-beta-1,6-N-acetylglucosamine synthase-like glycosyltransferase n=1 Tax=Allocatelliglobosispora scoriae TaxID=643052 RepID=A0A841BL74_9ACTN|nr:glycosyltransferase family 2 protein [Allocatelliglobosispora scoriae]MBB5868118.1 cellulose synthase/poly-beta-1,6-N-acetylglucosamine synthase-like glycosyltransferase [Allocatelliglobosispora scoriae]